MQYLHTGKASRTMFIISKMFNLVGFYVHSCRKMRYKSDYAPSYLLDPEHYTLHSVEQFRPLLDNNRYVTFPRPHPHIARADDDTGKPSFYAYLIWTDLFSGGGRSFSVKWASNSSKRNFRSYYSYCKPEKLFFKKELYVLTDTRLHFTRALLS